MTPEDELKCMKLHEVKWVGDIKVMRVYKGWLYTLREKIHCDGAGDQFQMTTTFVPYD